MTATFTQARDDIFGTIKDFWDGEVTAPAKILWDNSPGARPQDVVANFVQPWAKATVRNSFSRQSALSNSGGSHRYTSTGLMLVELWYPADKGHSELDLFGQLLVDALRGTRTTNGVILRNVRYQEQRYEGPWFLSHVIADFEYDQIA